MRRECRERFPPPPISKETASYLSRHASRHVRDARAVMHVGIAYLRWRGKRPHHSRRMRTRDFAYLARGPCPRQTSVHRRRRSLWARPHRVWDIRHWPHCICTDESRFKLYKYSLLMRGVKFERFAKFIFECQTSIHMWVYLFAINVLFLKKKTRRLYYRLWLSHKAPLNLSCMLPWIDGET